MEVIRGGSCRFLRRMGLLVLFLCAITSRANIFYELLYDCFEVPRLFFTSKETLFVGAFFVPTFFPALSVDHDVHNCFYCPHRHKNLCQMPSWCHVASDKGAACLGLGMGLSMLCWPDEEIREAGAAFSVGLTYVLITKDLFKKIHCEENRRPRNGCFDRYKKYYGGCPSGHLGLATYITTFMAATFGTVWVIPFGIWTGVSFFASLNGNRHYLSQLVAGGCLGAAIGFAASSTFKEWQNDHFCCEVGLGEGGGLAFRAAYSF